MMKIKNLLLVAIIAITTTSINAQDKEWGGFLGISGYNGDLAQSPIPVRGMRPAIGGFYRYNHTTHWATKVGLNVGYIASYDRYSGKGTDRENRNLSFYSPLVELSLVGEYNFMKYVSGSRKYRSTPYVFGGIALFYFDPQTNYNGTNYHLRDFVTEQSKADGVYSPVQLAIPIGVGYKFSMGKKKLWNLGFEVGYRITFTDYLDDVSGDLPSNYNTTLPATDKQLAYRGNATKWKTRWPRGNSDNNDGYFFFGVSLSKTIRKFKCNF